MNLEPRQLRFHLNQDIDLTLRVHPPTALSRTRPAIIMGRTAAAVVALLPLALSSPPRPIFGIGVYNDTPGSPLVVDQLPVASNLTGTGGFVLLFFETFDPTNPSLLLPLPWQVDALNQAYQLGLRPVVRLGQHSRNYRYFSDDAGHLHYTHLASLYAAYVAALPLPPPSSGPLFVGVGNEFNIRGEWLCTEGPGVFMNVSQVSRVGRWP